LLARLCIASDTLRKQGAIMYRQANVFWLWLLLLLLPVPGTSRPGPPRDARSGILDSSLIVIVKLKAADTFEIEQTLLGKIPQDRMIRLPGFVLFTYNDAGPDVVEPITSSTRILLFLQPDRDHPEKWAVTGAGYCFFWVPSPERTEELRQIASGAIALRKSWEAARDLPDREQRIKALWPYFWSEQGYFFRQTLGEFQKLRPVAGDYVAAQFDSLKDIQRKMLFGYLGSFGGEKLHQTILEYTKGAGAVTGGGADTGAVPGPTLPGSRFGPRGQVGQRTAPLDPAIQADETTADGIDGLSGFKDTRDLPYIRSVALAAVRRHYSRTCYAALAAFSQMPDKSNLTVIEEIRRAKVDQSEMVAGVMIVRTLATHKYPETIPLLAPFLDDKAIAEETERAMTGVTGKDLGPMKQSWLDWFKAQSGAN
jgi:hypothetical protein